MLTVCILTYNEEKHIGRALSEISKLSCEYEVLIVDSQSSDKTIEIAQRYRNVRIIENEFKDFASQRNYWIHHAHWEWVFMLDADEYPSNKLIEWLSESRYQEDNQTFAWNIPRKNYFLGSELRHTFPDFQKRVFRKDGAEYTRSVHEQLTHSWGAKNLGTNLNLEHWPEIKLNKWLAKLNDYTDKEAEEFDPRWFQSRYPKLSIVLYPISIFLINLIFKKWFLDWIHWLIFIWMNSIYKFIQIAKLIESRKNKPPYQ